MSSSGLIFAMIVGAWAAYLVPMWLRRQDELNEARPTERFSTAIRLLSGRAAMERRYARDTERRKRAAEEAGGTAEPGTEAGAAVPAVPDLRAFAEPVTMEHEVPRPPSPRAQVLARRRRTTMVLFLAFALGGMFAVVADGNYLWVPAIPALLLSAYIVHLRRQERRRYAFTMDQRRAEEAAGHLRERSRRLRAHPDRAEHPGHSAPAPAAVHDDAPAPRRQTAPGAAVAPVPAAAAPEPTPAEQDRRVIVEQTDHAEWVDQQHPGAPSLEEEPDSWDPAPVPLPTYVNAPVAPRHNRGVDLESPDTWSAARSTAAPAPAPAPAAPGPDRPRPSRGGPQRTPLFDQYADEDRPRAAGE
ncbi:divisome protein SepX/GlpR [Streptomyces sodiiphilus]|uniref:divisome protein SepX/GlpR n=1 Tax=Streptomyces sodiiphilus TaxID=226217 RepID=UPI0031CFBC04